MKIYVGNMAFSTTQDSLDALFSNYGQVQEVAVITDRDTGRPRGFAFVEMATEEAAQSAIAALDGKEVDGRSLRISEAMERGARGSAPPRGRPDGGGPPRRDDGAPARRDDGDGSRSRGGFQGREPGPDSRGRGRGARGGRGASRDGDGGGKKRRIREDSNSFDPKGGGDFDSDW